MGYVAVRREKTWIPLFLGIDFLSYGLFDTYTKLARSQPNGLIYFLDFPAIVQQFWNAHSHILDADLWTMGHAQNVLNSLSIFFLSNVDSIVFFIFIILTVGLIVAMTRYYPAFLSVSYGIFAGVALIGFYEGMANVAAMCGLTFLGPNSGVTMVIMVPSTGYGILKTYNVDIWGAIVTRFPGLLGDDKKDAEPVLRHLANEYSTNYHPEISFDIPEYKEVLRKLAEGEYGNHISPNYIQKINETATQYHLDPAQVAYDAYALSKKEEATANE